MLGEKILPLILQVNDGLRFRKSSTSLIIQDPNAASFFEMVAKDTQAAKNYFSWHFNSLDYSYPSF